MSPPSTLRKHAPTIQIDDHILQTPSDKPGHVPDQPADRERAARERAARDDWRVDIASEESFPASDSPGWR